MWNPRRRTAAVLVIGGILAALPFLLGSASFSHSATRPDMAAFAHAALLEHSQGSGDDSADAQAYTDRAYPASEITTSEIQGAIAANNAVSKRSAKPGPKWESLGPDTLNVDQFGTQSFIKPTQWSGRETAVTMGRCKDNGDCTLFVGAAGGGVWGSETHTSEL